MELARGRFYSRQAGTGAALQCPHAQDRNGEAPAPAEDQRLIFLADLGVAPR